MEITLLGTSAAEGWPGLFCRCEACGKARKLRGKNLRTRASALIDAALKIDLPPDTLHQVIEHDLDLGCLDALLFTHAHDDHFSPAELQYLGEYFVTPPRRVGLPVYGPPEIIDALAQRFDFKKVLIEPHILTAWQPARIAGYRVTPIVAQHDPNLTCFNYIIEDSEGASLLYASDTGWYEPPTWEFLQSVKLDGLLIECTKGPQETDYAGHLNIRQVIAMRQKLIDGGSFSPDSPVVTTHFSHMGGLLHDELEAAFAPHHIEPGYDGMRFTVRKEI